MQRSGMAVALTALSLLAACALENPGQSQGWIAHIGGLGPEVAFDVAETSDGRLCATGTFFHSATFGDAARQQTLEAAETQDIYLACYAHDGQLDRAIQFGANLGDDPRAIAALPGGDVLIAGFFSHRFGRTLKSDNDADIFLARISPEGDEVWARSFGGKLADNGNALAVTPDGHILLAGSFQDVITWKMGHRTAKLASAGGHDAFVFKLDGDGEIVWARRFGGPGRDVAARVAAGPDGRVLVAGTFEKSAHAGIGDAEVIALGNADAFVLALEENGDTAWIRNIAGKNREMVSGLAADSQGHVHLAGNFQDTIILPDGNTMTSAGGTDIFILRFDPEGGQVRSTRIGGSEIDEAFDLALRASDNLLISGYFQGEVDFQPGPGQTVLVSSGKGNSDGFVLELTAAGDYRQAIRAYGDGVEMTFAVAALNDGGLAAAGLFNADLRVETNDTATLQKRGKTDVFLARLDRGQLNAAAARPAVRQGARLADSRP